MIFIWTGWGILVLPIVAGTWLVVGGGLGALLQSYGSPSLQLMASFLGLLAAAAANWWVGRRLNSKPPRELIDAQTGQRVLLRRQHKLFWIRMEYWSIPVLLMALLPVFLLFATSATKGAP